MNENFTIFSSFAGHLIAGEHYNKILFILSLRRVGLMIEGFSVVEYRTGRAGGR